MTENKITEKVILRGYPKTIFFYPAAIVALVIGLGHDLLITLFPDYLTPGRLAVIFLVVFFFNLLIVTFDFSLGKITIGLLFGAVSFLVYLLLSPSVFVDESDPLQETMSFSLPESFQAGPVFYLTFAGGVFALLTVIIIVSRFYYWEIRSTEIYHHHGLFADTKRYPAQGAKITKETSDIFERVLFLSANIIIYPPEGREVIHVDNVWRAASKEKKIREVLSYVPDKRS